MRFGPFQQVILMTSTEKAAKPAQNTPQEHAGFFELLLVLVVITLGAVGIHMLRADAGERDYRLLTIMVLPLWFSFVTMTLFSKTLRAAAYHHLSEPQRRRTRVIIVVVHFVCYELSGFFFEWSLWWFVAMHFWNLPVTLLALIRIKQANAAEPKLIPHLEERRPNYNDNELYGRRFPPGGPRRWWW